LGDGCAARHIAQPVRRFQAPRADTSTMNGPCREPHGRGAAPKGLAARFPPAAFVTVCTADDGRCTARVLAHDGDVVELECAPPQRMPAVAVPGVDVTLMPIASARMGARGPVLARTDLVLRVELREPVAESRTARRQPRVAADEPVELTVVDSSGAARRRGRGRVKDLSLDGCAVATMVPVVVTSRLRLTLRLAGRAVEVHGRVARIRPALGGQQLVGVAFETLPTSARDAIAAVVRARAFRRSS
jgi:hypothetical protein